MIDIHSIGFRALEITCALFPFAFFHYLGNIFKCPKKGDKHEKNTD